MDLSKLLFNYQKDIANDDSPRKIILKARQIGFSFICAFLCVRKAAVVPNSLSMIISINQRSAEELLEKVKQWAQALQVASNNEITYHSNATEVILSNGSKIISIPGGNPDAPRGYTINGILILDEFAYIPNVEKLWQSVLPTLTNRIKGILPEVILGSTPAAKNSLFGKIWFEDLNFTHFEVPIERAIKDGLPVNLEELHKLVPDPEQFDIEFNCKWSDSQGTFIDKNILDFYQFDGKLTNNYYCGIDFGYKNDSTSIAIIKVEGDKKYLENIVVLKNKDFSEQFNIIKELHQKYNFQAGYCDENGIGAAISDQIKKQIYTKICGYMTTGSNKTPNYEHVRNEIFNHRLFFNETFKDELIQDFLNILKIVSETGKISYVAGRTFGNHSDITSSIVLCLQAIKDNPLNAAVPETFFLPSRFTGWSSRL